MSGIEYHQEAQRKQRVFDKKREAIERMRTIEKEQSEMIRRAQSSMYRDHQRKMDEYEGVLQGSRHGYNTRSEPRNKSSQSRATQHSQAHSSSPAERDSVSPDFDFTVKLPPSMQNLQRDNIYNIMHPYEFMDFSKSSI